MRTSPLKGLVRKGNSQGLNPQALKDKRKRDEEYMKGSYKAKKAENQVERRALEKKGVSLVNKDIHHRPDGSTVRVSTKANRGNFGKGTRT